MFKDKSISCEIQDLTSKSEEEGGLENDQKLFRIQELRRALAQVSEAKNTTSESLDNMNLKNVGYSGFWE